MFNKYDLLPVDLKVINMMVENPILVQTIQRYQRILYILYIVITAFFHFFYSRLLKSFENIIIRLSRLK